MSLIQEALKRQQEDAERTRGGQTPPTPSLPPPVPETVTEPVAARKPLAIAHDAPASADELPPTLPLESPGTEAPEASKSHAPNWSALAGISLLIILLVGGGVWLTWRFFLAPKPATPATAPSAIAKPAAPPPATKPAAASPVATTAPAAPVTAAIVPTTTTTIATPTATVPVAEAAKPVIVSASPSAEVVKMPTIWPVMTVSGVLGKGTKGNVVINGEIVAVNESVQDVKIISIGTQSVELEYKGEKKIVKVGGSTQ